MVGKVTKVIPKTKSSPLILTFQNGEVSRKGKGEKRKISVTNCEKTGLREVNVKIGKYDYVGNEEKPETGRRTFLVIRKAATGDTKLVEVGRTTPLLNTIHNVVKKTEALGGDFRSRNSELQKMFGGKKGIRKIEKSEKFRVNAATNEASLLSTIKGMEVKAEVDSIEKQISDSIYDFLPPCHRDATHVDNVYIISELIGQDVIDSMSSLPREAILDEVKLLPVSKVLMKQMGPCATIERLIAASMFDSLVRFIKMPISEIRKKSTLFSQHELIHLKIADKFCSTNGGKLTRNLQLRDKAVVYSIAISAALTQLVYTQMLSVDCGYGKKKLLQFCRAAGCVPKDRGSPVCILKLPLPSLPSFSKGRS